MTIELGEFGIFRRADDTTPEIAQEVERLGFGALWLGGSPSGDLGSIERLLDATDSIPIATGIVNMWHDDASTVANSYHRVSEHHPERFLLGVGIGHPEATSGGLSSGSFFRSAHAADCGGGPCHLVTIRVAGLDPRGDADHVPTPSRVA